MAEGTTTVELPAKAAVAAQVAGGNAGAVAARVEAWLAARGAAPPDGVAVHRDGSVRVALPAAAKDATLAAWKDFDPSTPTTQEATEDQARNQVRAALAALDAGTATLSQIQRVVAWLVRRALRG